MKKAAPKKYMAVKRSYGFLDQAWEPGWITQETEKVPPQNALMGVLFVLHEPAMTLLDAKIKAGQAARLEPRSKEQ